VEGDTNTVLASALAAAKLHIQVGHVEAGLRSFDERMPEELNRILTDHMSHFLFAPTQESKKNLRADGLNTKRIFVVGNTVVDAVFQHLKIAKRPMWLENQLGFVLKKNKYFLITAHRAENVDDKQILKDMFEGFSAVYRKYRLPLIYPIHPRTKKMIKKFKIAIPEGLFLTDPINYLDLLYLLHNTKLVLTDSGGIQEEACAVKVPCVTLRISTERPETVWVGANMIAGTSPRKILRCVDMMLKKEKTWKNPLGKGDTGEKIVKILLEKFA